ncbi:MAG: Mut7-C ubiquitin/RNAse domain-containing protein [Gammaproteobacteria bacterium]|nr:MAG: Mut7-C ubiquitin/RNAse domain-containing protein [Gammaproteobacteria bacterium]
MTEKSHSSPSRRHSGPRPGLANARFRFYEELNDFLPESRRKTSFTHTFNRRASIKDMIESLGVPHTEVELILVNGKSVDFSYIVRDGDVISVYPVFESLDIRPLLRLRPEPLRDNRFVVDTHLGRLARYLRLLGFDSLYSNDFRDAEIARISSDQHRILLTRDRLLLHRSIITHGYFVREAEPLYQAGEVLHRFDMYRDIRPWTRCTLCNGELEEVSKAAIEHRLEPRTQLYYTDFRICRDCSQLYWKGSHFRKMSKLIRQLRQGHYHRKS